MEKNWRMFCFVVSMLFYKQNTLEYAGLTRLCKFSKPYNPKTWKNMQVLHYIRL